MQRERKDKSRNDHSNMGDPYGIFQGFGSFGSRRSMMPSLFGGRDPFDDPFFSRPIGSMFDSSMFGPSSVSADKMQTNSTTGVVIEELPSDGEEDKEKDTGAEDEKDIGQKNCGSNLEPSIQHPNEGASERKSQIVSRRNDRSRVEPMQPQASSFSFSKVTYGGIDGAYYTSTRTRRAGVDGVVVEESKEADRTTGQAMHRISRGIHDKGHSVTRKLSPDGKVDTVQALHNLNEDELAGFEEAWKGNGKGHMPHRNDGFGMHGNSGFSSGEPKGWGGLLLPFGNRARHTEGGVSDKEVRATTSGGRTKNVVRINID